MRQSSFVLLDTDVLWRNICVIAFHNVWMAPTKMNVVGVQCDRVDQP